MSLGDFQEFLSVKIRIFSSISMNIALGASWSGSLDSPSSGEHSHIHCFFI